MSVTLDFQTPLSSAELATIDPDRVAEIVRRHQLVGEFLKQEGYAALLVREPANFRWFTVGGEFPRVDVPSRAPALFITPDARVVLSTNVDTPQIFEHEIAGLGFQLKERTWTEPLGSLVQDVCRGRKVASDSEVPGLTNLAPRLPALRLPLSGLEEGSLREAGKIVAHALEATARGLTSGRTEAELAGELAHRLLKHEVEPIRLQVLADGRGRRFRNWRFDGSVVQQYCTLSVLGRYRGLHVGAARTVCLGEPPQELLQSYHQASLVECTGIYFSQPEWELFEVWNRVQRIYEKSGSPEEWRLAEQAEIVEYEAGSILVMPNSQFRLGVGTPVFWHPSAGPALLGDTILVSSSGVELLTPATDWPVVPIVIKGTTVPIPGILLHPGQNS